MNSTEETYRVLIVDDDANIRELFRAHLESAAHSVVEAKSGEECQNVMDDEIDIILLDVQMPGMSGIECLERIREKYSDPQVIMVSSISDPGIVVEAVKRGAFWYLSKTLESSELLSLVAKAGRHSRLARENRRLRTVVESPRMPFSFLGQNEKSKDLLIKAEKVAQLDSTVLIGGETGTGKSLLARVIHENGPRSEKPFVIVSCAALPRDLLEAELFGHERGAFTGAVGNRPGRIEMAEGGTLFLDEIGDMPLELQPKLLVFLQERTFQRIGSNKTRTADVRIIAATHQDLLEMSDNRSFREDLFFRLNVLSLSIPPLNSRPQDIELIAEHYLSLISNRRGAAQYRLDQLAVEKLLSYHWPGNVRELENVLERATAFTEDEVIRCEDLSFFGKSSNTPQDSSLAGRSLEEIETQAIIDTLILNKGNKAAAARMLGISEKSVYNKIERLGLASRIEASLKNL